MEQMNIYEDIAKRTQGDIYIGVVGPVRTGKSTFIKKFMETLVIPNIDGEYRKERANDELPQSAAGRTIMTTEPKFIPEEAVQIKLTEAAALNVRMIDCVGYIVPSSLGYIENDAPRMVMTPWFAEEVPFNMAAEVGTQKVITEHSTIGLVVTTDGTISDIPRAEYADAENRVISELKEINKPFVVLVNSTNPNGSAAKEMCRKIEAEHSVPAVAIDCMSLDEEDIKQLLGKVLYTFPIREILISMPKWINSLEKDHWLKSDIFSAISDAARDICRISEVEGILPALLESQYIIDARLDSISFGMGSAKIKLSIDEGLFYKILGETTGLAIEDESALMPCIIELVEMRKEYEKVRSALEEVKATGYGIVLPTMEELSLEDPEIMRQGGKYGVRLKASAPSIHIECIKQKLSA